MCPLWGGQGIVGHLQEPPAPRELLDADIRLLLVPTQEWGAEKAGTATPSAPCSCAQALLSSCLCFRAGGAGLQRGVPLPGTP